MHITYTIPGNPIPLARPRFSKGHVFDCQKREKTAIALIIHNQRGNTSFLEGPLRLDITFFMKIPKKGKNLLWHIKRPDLSNMLKLYEDVAIGILYEDDSQIAEIVARKIYDEYPRTEFTLTHL